MSEKLLKKEKFYWLKVLLDALFLLAGFFCIYWLERGSLALDANFRRFLPLLLGLWLLNTILSKKFKVGASHDYFGLLRPYWLAAAVFVLLLSAAIFLLDWTALSRVIVYGSVGLCVILETFYLSVYFSLVNRSGMVFHVPFAALFFLSELLVVPAAFFILYFHRYATFLLEEKYQTVLMALFFTWLLVSLLLHRFHVQRRDTGIMAALLPFWQSEALILGLVSLMSFFAGRGGLSRFIIFGSLALFAAFENIVVLAYYFYGQFRDAPQDPEPPVAADPGRTVSLPTDDRVIEAPLEVKYRFPGDNDNTGYVHWLMECLFLKKFPDVSAFIEKYIDINHFDILTSLFIPAAATANVDFLENESLSLIYNFEKINDIRHINRLLTHLNRKLQPDGVLVGSFESLVQRRQRIFAGRPGWPGRILYFIDFAYKRVMPKLPLLKHLYFSLSHGKKRVLSRTEALGRVIYCGYDIIGLREINGQYYFIAKKSRQPRIERTPSYGPVFRQRRVGLDGKIIHIFKLRTMHPFAEYLHRDIYEKHKLDEGGKIKLDYRLTVWGRFLRKTWIDELPMLANWLKGDLKLVGVRPLSETFFKTYPEDLQKERVRFKPGLVPPYYADMPETIEAIWESERRYLRRYQKHPRRTDALYLLKALGNILFHHARSG